MKARKDLSTLLDSLCAGIAAPRREASPRDALFDAVVRGHAPAAVATKPDSIPTEIVARVVEASCAPLAAIDTHPNQGERS